VLKRITATACLLAIAMGIAWAGDMAKPAAGDMEAMKASMAKCAVCKHMAPHLDELGPVMKMEVAKLNDGIAVMHYVTDPAKAATFHAVCKEMHVAGGACMTMTDEEAKAQLCENCQEMRSVTKAGAKMSAGETKNGDIMVFTSADPAVQTKISALGEKCALMAGAM
jgi:hypothetical protein